MLILAIDPGPKVSTTVLWGSTSRGLEAVLDVGQDIANPELLGTFLTHGADRCVIERVRSYGMSVGADVFETCEWVGRFAQTWDANMYVPAVLLERMKVKMHLCHNSRAKDTNIRQALIDRFGPPGTKAKPGKLYGVSKHAWAALGLAVTFSDSITADMGTPTMVRQL